MKLFWKIYGAIFLTFTAVSLLFSCFIYMKMGADAEKSLIDGNSSIGSLVALEVERGFVITRWPFESLNTIEKLPDFKFWFVVTDSAMIYLANDIKCMGAPLSSFLSDSMSASKEGSVVMHPDRHLGIYIKTIEKSGQRWSFLLGFSTNRVSAIKKQIITVTAASLLVMLTILGVVLYFVVRYFVRPVRALAKGALEIGSGNLDYRLQNFSNDEIGSLASSFNKMAASLQNTTVSRNYLNVILESMQDLLLVLEPGGSVMTSNPATSRLLGYKDSELIGLPIGVVLVSPEESHEALSLDALAAQPHHIGVEACLQKVTGERVPVIFNSSLVNDKDGKLLWIVCTAKDITDRKNFERSLLEKAQELARSNADLEQFASIASHDLREPLRMISSYLKLLSTRYASSLDDTAREFIHFAVDGAVRLQRMIEGLLAFSRVGKNTEPLSPVSMESVFALARRNLEVMIDEKKADVTRDQLPAVMGIESYLVQLVQNLIANSLKFCTEAKPTVHISANEKGSDWVVSVRDNGIGIAPAHHERIFKIFQRLHTREAYEGTGIGLAVCKRIVEYLGGRIWVESDKEKGATFFFSLAKTPKA